MFTRKPPATVIKKVLVLIIQQKSDMPFIILTASGGTGNLWTADWKTECLVLLGSVCKNRKSKSTGIAGLESFYQ